MIRTLITETYGGKIDDEGDFSRLRVLVKTIFTPDAFNANFKLVDIPENPLYVPEGIGMPEFLQWVNMLPEREPPTYLGLPANAEKLLLVGHGKGMIENLGTITNLLEEGEQAMAEAANVASAA
jgi:dynein heavy chain 1